MWDKLVKLINSMPKVIKENLKLEIVPKIIKYKIKDKEFELSISEFENTIDNTLEYSIENVLHNNNKYETFIENIGNRTYRSFFPMDFGQINDDENNITYRVGKPSLQYLVLYLENQRENGKSRLPFYHNINKIMDSKNLTFADLLCNIYRPILTITINSVKDRELTYFSKICNSFLFNMAYNTSSVYKAIGDFDSFVNFKSLYRLKQKEKVVDIDTPKRIYIKELTDQYYMGLASGEPFIEFICYYHIMEYFFHSVYREDTIEQVRKELTKPGFSAKKEKSIVRLIDVIEKKYGNSKNNINEQNALELTLRKYIPSLDELKNDLHDFYPKIIEYYNDNIVKFSGGNTIDLTGELNDNMYIKIASRIYKTRNAVIHNKSDETVTTAKGAYKPFKDDGELSKEIPIMRIIAELIIIESSHLL